MADHLLLAPQSQEILSDWLRGRTRPPLIDITRYARFLNASLDSISFSEMAILCDSFGPSILDQLMWPGRKIGVHQPQPVVEKGGHIEI